MEVDDTDVLFSIKQCQRSSDDTLADLAKEKNIFLIAEIEGHTAGYAKLVVHNIELRSTAKRPWSYRGSILGRNISVSAWGSV